MKTNIIATIIILLQLSLNSQTLEQIGYYNQNGIMSVCSKNNFMILGNGEIIDNTDPTTPTLTAQFSFSGDGSTVITNNNFAYFGTGMSNDLYIVDISNITFPVQKSFIDFGIGNGVFGMDILKNTLYVALGTNGVICSIDVTNNSNPIILDTLSISGGQCRDIVAYDDYAFAAHDNGLKVINVLNPANMELITSIGSGYNSIDISTNHVFLGKTNGGIDVFDISDPTNPSPTFSIPNSGGMAWDIKYNNNNIYLATNSEGLYVYRIDGNTGIEQDNFLNTGNGQSFGVCVQDSLVLLTGLINGVAILKYTDTINSINTITSNTNNINIFPNPTKDFIVIDSKKIFINTIKIYNSNGKLIKQIIPTETTKKIDISSYTAGNYYIQIENQKNRITKKIVILK